MISEDKIAETTMQLVLAAKKMEKISANVNQQSQQVIASLSQLHHDHKQLLTESSAILREQASQGISVAMQEQLGLLEKRIKNLCVEVDHTKTGIQHTAKTVKQQAKMALWSTMATLGFAVLAVIGFTAWYWK